MKKAIWDGIGLSPKFFNSNNSKKDLFSAFSPSNRPATVMKQRIYLFVIRVEQVSEYARYIARIRHSVTSKSQYLCGFYGGCFALSAPRVIEKHLILSYYDVEIFNVTGRNCYG